MKNGRTEERKQKKKGIIGELKEGTREQRMKEKGRQTWKTSDNDKSEQNVQEPNRIEHS